MKLNEKGAEKLLDIIEYNRKVNNKISTSPEQEASKMTLDMVFD